MRKTRNCTSNWLQYARSALAGQVLPRKLLITVTHLRTYALLISNSASKSQPISPEPRKYQVEGKNIISLAYMLLRVSRWHIVEKKKTESNGISFCTVYQRDINLELGERWRGALSFDSQRVPFRDSNYIMSNRIIFRRSILWPERPIDWNKRSGTKKLSWL